MYRRFVNSSRRIRPSLSRELGFEKDALNTSKEHTGSADDPYGEGLSPRSASQKRVDGHRERGYTFSMPKRSSKQTDAANVPDTDMPNKALSKEKNPAAVALGRLGGLKGGKARAEALSVEQRSEIAKRAAEARWHRK